MTFQRRKSHSTVIKNKTLDYLNETWIKVKGFVGQPNRDKDSLTISGLKRKTSNALALLRQIIAESLQVGPMKEQT